jgi:predicted HAD superfamily phosphohydrolase YqeG
VAKAVKPLPFAFLRALSKVGSARNRAAVVGDQMFTDVLGGRLLGMKTMLVVPLSHTDLPHTLLLRKLESLVLAGRRPLP